MEDKVVKLLENTKYDAHKGESWRYPENSYGAIKSALENPEVDAVEFDVRMTKDCKLIIRHDDSMFTTSSSFKKVSDMTLDELKKLSVKAHKVDYFIHRYQILNNKKTEYGNYQKELLNQLISKKDGIITLEELLQIAPNDKKLLLEVKGSDKYYKTDKYSRGILELVNNYNMKNILIHGFDSKLMMWFQEHAPKAVVGIGISTDLKPLDLPLNHACFNLSKMNDQLKQIIDALEKRPEREFHFWKVDTRKELELYKLFLSEMAERELNSTTSIMTNDVKACKMLVKDCINNLQK